MMKTVPQFDGDPKPPRPIGRAAVAYAVGWLVAVAAAVGLVAVLSGHESTMTLPPVQERDLVVAARHGGCQLHRLGAGERLNPPVDGPAGTRPAAAGVYTESPPIAALTAAVREGLIVIQYREDLPDEAVDALKLLQQAVPKGTIVAPNVTGMPFALAATAYRQLLGCPAYSPRVIDAVRLFRGRYLGSGP